MSSRPSQFMLSGHSTNKVREPIGTTLRNARIAKGLTLDHLADATRISAAQLEDIERGNYEHFPAEVYVRGFIRSYAQAVGVDSEQALASFASECRTLFGRKSGFDEDWESSTVNRGLRLGVVVFCSVVLVGLAIAMLTLGHG